MTMHGDREGANALLRSAPGALLEAISWGVLRTLSSTQGPCFECGTVGGRNPPPTDR